ncbi:hypothetical protein [Dyella humicola]|uniref:hypothetical protein n=1 Tax=Dyella humicola TaxID=2992126 RepID=UPI00225A0E50|nr:hypothetical protein [Dyella humicola]
MKKVFYGFALASLLTAGTAEADVVVAARTGNDGYVFASTPKGDAAATISVRSAQDGSTYDLSYLVGSKTPSEGRWLPEGDYQIVKWNGLDFGAYAPFHVESGKVTNLGSLVPVDVGEDKFVVLPLKLREDEDALSLVLRALQPSLSSSEVIAWSPSGVPSPLKYPDPPHPSSPNLGALANLILDYVAKVNRPSLQQQLLKSPDAATLFAIAKSASPPLTHIGVVDEQGNLYYGADYGQVRVRDPHGSWGALDTGALQTVTALTRRDGSLIAGFEDGTIRRSNDNGTSWQLVASLDCADTVVDISWSGNRWLATTAGVYLDSNKLARVNRFCVYASSDDDITKLTKIKVVDPASNLLLAPVHAQVVSGGYYINMSPDLMRLDFATMSWSRVSLSGPVEGFAVSKDGKVVSAYHPAGMFSKLYVSDDMGATWKEYKRPPYIIQDVQFLSSGDGFAVRKKLKFATAALELYKFNSARSDWTFDQELPDECSSLLDDAEKVPRFCITRSGSIIALGDGKLDVEFVRN